MNILTRIVASKVEEVAALYRLHRLSELSEGLAVGNPLFYDRLRAAKATCKPFFITEFKRKSPSEGWINQHADVAQQVLAYRKAGAGAISVLTDGPWFGGSYDDLRRARAALGADTSVLLLQKDFIIDPIQIYLAKRAGADMILLIAAILAPEQLDALRRTAEGIGLGVLVEVHDQEELDSVQHLDFPVLGVNNRDLKTFRTALNRVNTLRAQAGGRMLIAESGVQDYRHFQMLRGADGFLIGTGLMRASGFTNVEDWFQTAGRYLFKACGIRNGVTLEGCLRQDGPDFLGINFSPASKRRPDAALLEKLSAAVPSGAVAVFYRNSETEMLDILERYPFTTVQLYAGDVSPEFVRRLRNRVILAIRAESEIDLRAQAEAYAPDVDCFILDGAVPGSGQSIAAAIPDDFPYPFLLAGGMHAGNLERIKAHPKCIGVDTASGIETEGQVDLEKIDGIALKIRQMKV